MKFGLRQHSFVWPDSTPDETWERTKRLVQRAEADGFASYWLMDHFYNLPVHGSSEHEPFLDVWTTLPALAAVTERIRLGPLVSTGSLATRRRPIVDERLKELMQQLGGTINETLSDSESIAEVIGEIKREGYDVYLVLEATIGFNKRANELEAEVNKVLSREDGPPPDLDFSIQDQDFLKALKITVDD
jgi:hypothetical protein